MNFKMIIKRAASFTLAVAMTIPLAACGGSKKKLPEKQTLENVYTTEKFDIGIEQSDEMNFDNPFVVGEDIFITASDWRNPDIEDGEVLDKFNQSKILYKYDKDTGKSKEILKLEGYSSSSFTDKFHEYWDVYYSRVTIANDGTVWTLKREHHSYEDFDDDSNSKYESHQYLIHMNMDGSVIEQVDIYDIIKMENGGEFYASDLICDVEGGLLVGGYSGYYLIDDKLSLKSNITFDQEMWGTVTKTGNGTVVYAGEYYDEAAQKSVQNIYTLDVNAAKFVKLELPSDTNMGVYDTYGFFSGPDSKLYYQTSTGISLLDVSTGTTKEVLNWLNSDINSYRVVSVKAFGDDGFLISEYDSEYTKQSYSILSPAGEKIEKYIITLASVYLNDTLKEAVIDFNRKNAEYRIILSDYSVYNTLDNYNAGVEKLNSDIISNKIPDIIDMSGLDYDTYASKRILADLYTLMDSDTTFDKSEYLENILKSTEYNGKLYSIIPNFSVSTMIAKEDNVGDVTSMTMQQLNDLLKKYPDASVFSKDMTRASVINYFCMLSVRNYIDFENGKCNFDSDDFRKFLEFAKQVPEEIPELDDNYWMDYDSYFRENKVLLNYFTLSSYSEAMYNFNTAGGPVSYVGFPTANGSGSVINAELEIALSASSPYLDVTWQLVKYLLSPEYQSTTGDYMFSIRQDRMEELADNALKMYKDDEYIEEDYVEYGSSVVTNAEMGKTVVVEPGYYGSSDHYNKITEEMIDKVNDCIKSVTNVSRSGDTDEYKNIISEEAGAFFAGQKPVDVVTASIQSRIQLMVQEQS